VAAQISVHNRYLRWRDPAGRWHTAQFCAMQAESAIFRPAINTLRKSPNSVYLAHLL